MNCDGTFTWVGSSLIFLRLFSLPWLWNCWCDAVCILYQTQILCWVCKYVGFKLKVFFPTLSWRKGWCFLVLTSQGRILVGQVLSNSRHTSGQVASSFILCLHLLIYVEETKSIMVGLNLFLPQVLNLKLSMSLALRKMPLKLEMHEWLLFVPSVWRDVISALPAICRLFVAVQGYHRLQALLAPFTAWGRFL